MAKKILMPKMGMTMENGIIVKWLIKEGDFVEKGDILLTVETDKATLDVEAFQPGTILKILAREGETIPVLCPIGIIGEQGELVDETNSNDVDGIRATPLARQMVKEKQLDIKKISANSKGIIAEREVLDYISLDQVPKNRIKATPAAIRKSENLGIDLSDIDKDTRIYKKDVIEYIEQRASSKDAGQQLPQSRYLEQSRVQKVASEMLSKSWEQIPMVTNCIELDMSEALFLCGWLNEKYERIQMHFGITDVIIKALGFAMELNPSANVRFEGNRIKCLDTVDIGMATATEKGLIVPVVRKVSEKNLFEINKEKKELISLAREEKLTLDHMGGASTTLSNMGPYRAEIFTPINNYPESCIFGTGEVKKKAVVVEDEIVIRPMMWLNFTYDHRVLDGAQAAKLLNTVKDVIELPSLIAGYEPY